MRILVVEDSNTSRMYLQEILKDVTGKETHIGCAASGEEALEKFEERRLAGKGYNLIFMDIILPGIDGLQTLEKIRDIEQKNQTPEDLKSKAIITTALDDATKASRAFFQCEAISYITKPITVEKIQAELNKFGLI
ncbi:response regulator [Maridesulfovibrio hydrothermalis]|uniref:Response regulator receiver protein n=1 Tax=Maridesulfovibrio hydrothermalis AM13 = DSM 14728 TaxID=1121451 RepID=L0RCP2_9BACT|nr:response regulator [Maridesulfovibrio hydrothermalis]CCO23950.1 Response regulator receiver protein [Maridesulfovibrio hydrothermalis AM13 = DSM 14728]